MSESEYFQAVWQYKTFLIKKMTTKDRPGNNR